MDRDRIDASVGLTFSLSVFQRYRRSGILQARIRHVPGVRGECNAYLFLANGHIASCYVEDKQGQRFSISPELLCRIDDEKGPFEWTFQPYRAQPAAAQEQQPASASATAGPTAQPPPQFSGALIPRVFATLYWGQLSTWSPLQKQMLYDVLNLIDGRRTIQEIKSIVNLPPEVVDGVLHTLLTLHTIVLSS